MFDLLRPNIFFGALLICGSAFGQSPALLESVRLQRAGVALEARGELTVCATTHCVDQGRLNLLTGFLELSEGHAAEAASTLGAVKAPEGLEAFHAWYFGEALSWAGQSRAALKTFQRAQKTAPKWLERRISRRMAELFLEKGEASKALALLALDPEVGFTPELLYTRALARQQSRLPALAQADWKMLALRFPTHPHGAAAQRRLQRAGQWLLTFEEQFSLAQARFIGGDAEGCLSVLESIEPLLSQGRASAQIALLKAQALLMRGPSRSAAAMAELAIAIDGPSDIAAQALLTLGKRLMRIQDDAGARAAFRKLDLSFPEDPAANDAGYLAAWLAMNAGDLETAITEFNLFETRHRLSKKRDEARWFHGFSLIRARQYQRARDILLKLPSDFPKSQLVPQALYWATRALELSSPSANVEVKTEYRALVGNFPGTFYGLLSAQRLEALEGVAVPLPFGVSVNALEVKRPAALNLAEALSRTGLFRDAALAIANAIPSMPSSEALQWGHALQALGEFGAAHALAARHLWGAAYTQRSPEALALMYPRAFRSSVETWSQKHQLEPALAWAIMRRESGFNPDVISSANARGLMQIIPPTAKAIALDLKIPPPDEAELFSPEWNIRLGTWYLRALLNRLGHPALAAAAYNAGPSSVARWVKERGELPLDQWVEEIPLKETRGYVKQVTCDLFIYRQLYGGATAPLSLVVPQAGSGVDF